jgi:hypothetical protein
LSNHSDDQTAPANADVQTVVRQVIEEFLKAERSKAEPAYKAELVEERKRRESLESRLNQVVEENRQARAAAEEMDRHTQIRSELQRLGKNRLGFSCRKRRNRPY